jgi:transposase-like protein
METATVQTEIVDDGQQRDRRGRVSWPKQRRRELLAEYERSGMSQAAFARRAGVRYPTFAHWVQEARREPRGLSGSKHKTTVAPRFAEVRLGVDNPAPTPTPELSVTLPGGLIARGTDATALAALVRALLVRG